MAFAPVLMTLGYVLSNDREHVLMVRRHDGLSGAPAGIYNGLGGKVEPSEDVAAGMIREIEEEAGIAVDALALRGTISWPGAGNHADGRFGFVFLITAWTGEPLACNSEGSLEWVPLADLLAGRVPMWPGRERWLPLVFDEDPRPFHGIEPFADGALLPAAVTIRRW